jgi:hypothetical protein
VLGTVAVEPERDEGGSVPIWLDPGILARLKALRGPGESYSDAIIRVRGGEGEPLPLCYPDAKVALNVGLSSSDKYLKSWAHEAGSEPWPI